jgi:hypothetical protein
VGEEGDALVAWMTPGEAKVYDLDQEDEARAWVAA